ncbi:uncharacterized protein PAN0_002c0922 [Moesziomyces antarcticus]|uniref:Uncharacterized protein n=1 Tax=Pseudozyma antarctica TaxID=84753 RepID=A0A5C3FI35_PSEA2|nr:uncharacterized protein PAN0_002c0922 [Moesziomyces antarcticus]GAK62720.1 hypothetical protein PAN0_002c0922 [Moesziomyces antarcticus]SPO43806.1 uncharacterized protein PSANT_01491 [Moesziomyces antarcticus]
MLWDNFDLVNGPGRSQWGFMGSDVDAFLMLHSAVELRFASEISQRGVGFRSSRKGRLGQLHCSAPATVAAALRVAGRVFLELSEESLVSAPLSLPLIATTITVTLANHSASLGNFTFGHAIPLRTLSERVGTPNDWLASSECHFGSRPPLLPSRLAGPIVLASLGRRIVSSSQLPGL